jgi:hypothetical protein
MINSHQNRTFVLLFVQSYLLVNILELNPLLVFYVTPDWFPYPIFEDIA